MQYFVQILAVLLPLTQPFVAGGVLPRYFQTVPFTRRDLSVEKVQRELGAIVSKGTTIFGPEDHRFPIATEQYSTHSPPHIEVVAVPATEDDVSVIVEYCNANSIDFLAVNRGHARTYSIGAFSGLMIDLGQLLDIKIQPDQKSAWFQGGTFDGQVMDYLWERGFVATTGSCDCVGMMGPGLGGGHGRHEGLYGLISDNIIQLNVVLANGIAIRVNDTSYPDLLWGMKGAGHNFGIVTSFELNIYPREVEIWHWHNYIFTEDKLERLYDEANKLHGNVGDTPLNLALTFSSFTVNRTISEDKAVIFWSFAYRGSAEEAEKILAPFNEIESAYDESGDVPYPEISIAQVTAIDTPTCAKNNTWVMSTAGLKRFNVTTTRQIYELHNKNLQKYPEIPAAYAGHDSYSNAGMLKFKPEDSAFPFRDYNHLTSFGALVPAGADPELTSVARKWADDVRDLWNSGQSDVAPSNYVNYATGFESLTSIYGDEAWRLERLVALKHKYDPQNKFRFYNPIIRD